jgi:pSer/pThr/pTyr-binding forkhead associated (FHA) protein
MVQFKILSGKKAGTRWGSRRFPVRIGRAASSDLQSDEDGVWDEHLRLDFNARDGFVLTARQNALARVNGQPLANPVALRNGDLIEIGSLKMQFWLAETRQRGLALREWLTWVFIALICLGQVGLIYWLVWAETRRR